MTPQAYGEPFFDGEVVARIRTIKPEFWRNEGLSSISAEACLLAVGLLNVCDDEGFFRANPKLIEADVFPLRELSGSTTVLLRELSEIGYIALFSGEDGKLYGQVVNFAKHQVINKATPSKIKELCKLPYDYGSPPVELPFGKERKGKELGKEKRHIPTARAAGAKVSVDDPYFERFWDAYSHKIGRAKALQVWNTIKPDAALAEQIIGAARVYHGIIERTGSRFVKHPETWLRGEHWQDDPMAIQRASMPPMTATQAMNAAFQRAMSEPQTNTHTLWEDAIDVTPTAALEPPPF